MLHEIAPLNLDNSYVNAEPDEDSLFISFSYGNILVREGEHCGYPRYCEVRYLLDEYTYIFSITGKKYFLCTLREDCVLGYEYVPMQKFRAMKPKEEIFAGMTAYHLYVWYRDNRYCGRCGKHMVHDEKERMMRCDSCGNRVYPKIMPAVIVGVIKGDSILVTRYKGRPYKGYALIAGFNEIGETAEETVAREVMEEAGIEVEDIRYVTSQPWGIAQDLLLGYFCRAKDDSPVKIDEEELSWAEWVKRDELDVKDEDVSLTNRMLCMFAEGKVR